MVLQAGPDDLPLVEILFEIERTGMLVDKAALADISATMETDIARIAAKIFEAAGGEFNINSPGQLGEVFERLNLPLKRRTSTGKISTSKDVLEAMSSGGGPKKVLITLGYSGWDAGQLEDEIGRNGWLTVDADPAIIFDTPTDKRYDRALSLLGIDPRMLSQEAGHA